MVSFFDGCMYYLLDSLSKCILLTLCFYFPCLLGSCFLPLDWVLCILFAYHCLFTVGLSDQEISTRFVYNCGVPLAFRFDLAAGGIATKE